MDKTGRAVCRILIICSIIMSLPYCAAAYSAPVNNLAHSGKKWNNWNEKGDLDSLVAYTRPLLESAMDSGDSVFAFYAGMVMAQAYISTQQQDSAKKYLDMVWPYFDGCDRYNARCLYYNVLGHYLLQSRLDYEKAVQCFTTALEYADRHGDAANIAAVTYDLVYIFWIFGDKNGMRYARKAYKETLSLGEDSSPHCMSMSMMSMMELVSGDIDSAEIFCNKLAETVRKKGYSAHQPDVDMLMGDIALQRKDSLSAIKHYTNVATFPMKIYPSKRMLAYWKLGNIYNAGGDADLALRTYNDGLELSYRYGILDFREELLKAVYETYHNLGYADMAMDCYNRYKSFSDSIAEMGNKGDFYTMMMQYQNIRHENEVRIMNLMLSETRLKVSLVSSVCVILVIVCLFLYLLGRERRKKYLLLAEKYQQTFESSNTAPCIQTEVKKENNASRELYEKLQELMRTQKTFMEKNISRESLAEKLGTNRTYLSKAINECSGKTFNDYINSWRINEAIHIISSDSGNNVNAKQLAEDLGYANPNIFYSIFKRETGCPYSVYRKNLAAIRSGKA